MLKVPTRLILMTLGKAPACAAFLADDLFGRCHTGAIDQAVHGAELGYRRTMAFAAEASPVTSVSTNGHWRPVQPPALPCLAVGVGQNHPAPASTSALAVAAPDRNHHRLPEKPCPRAAFLPLWICLNGPFRLPFPDGTVW